MPESQPRVAIALQVNGKQHALTVEPRTLLVSLLREHLDLTGTHIGCDTSYCGACTVLLNGQSVKSCTLFAVQADGGEITTVEGFAREGELHPLQQAFLENYGLQCGYCTPGFLCSALQLLEKNPDPDEKAIRKGLAGNTCRCTGYQAIVQAVRSAAEKMKADKMKKERN